MDGVVMLRGIWRYRYLIMTRYPSRYVTVELSEALPRLRTAAKPNPRRVPLSFSGSHNQHWASGLLSVLFRYTPVRACPDLSW